MSLTKLLPVILLMMAQVCRPPPGMKLNDSGIRREWAVQPAQPAADTSARTEKPAPRWFRLSNGRQVTWRLEGGAVYAGAIALTVTS